MNTTYERPHDEGGVWRVVRAAGPGAVIVLFVVLGFIAYSVRQVAYFQERINRQGQRIEELVRVKTATLGIVKVLVQDFKNESSHRAEEAAASRAALDSKVDRLTAHLDCVLSIRPENRTPTRIRECLGPDTSPELEQKITEFYGPPQPPSEPTVIVHDQQTIIVPTPVPTPVIVPAPDRCAVDVGVVKGLCR